MKLMTVVFGGWGLSIEFAELEIKNRSMCYLDAENVNLHHEKMQRTYASVLEGY